MRIEYLPSFERGVRRLLKKYPSFRQDLLQLEQRLLNNPREGTLLRRGARKIRLAVSSKGKGKSGGARVISLLIEIDACLYLLYIYDKSELSDIPDSYLDSLVAEAQLLHSD
jgi:mRNA-degrading endonuclease RelE of RelBE toxin-antitoxin system